MLSENTKAIIAWLNVCVFWGTTYLVIRIGVGHLPPMLFAGVRWLIAGSVMTAFLRWRGKRLPQGKEFVHLGVVGVALLGCANGLVVFAEQWIPSGLTAYSRGVAAAAIIVGVFIVKQGSMNQKNPLT